MKAKELWEQDSQKAVTIFQGKYITLKCEITKQSVKFFRNDDAFTCYTYPPLHELKKDKDFIKIIKDTMEEANMHYLSESVDSWIVSSCDLPSFPISVIFHSDYTNYKCKVYY